MRLSKDSMPYPTTIKQNTRATVLLTQYFDFIFELADKIYALKRGEVVYGSKKFTIDWSKLAVQIGV